MAKTKNVMCFANKDQMMKNNFRNLAGIGMIIMGVASIIISGCSYYSGVDAIVGDTAEASNVMSKIHKDLTKN